MAMVRSTDFCAGPEYKLRRSGQTYLGLAPTGTRCFEGQQHGREGILHAVFRDVLNERTSRRMAVLKPLEVAIEVIPQTG
jgi:hypothetical protein